MNWMAAGIKWIMLISGALTCTMLYAAIAPQASLRSMFGTTIDGPLAEIVVRNWGALIALVGAMLIYGAFVPQSRRLVLIVAALSKLFFIALVLTYGRQFLGHQVGVAVVVDMVMILLYLVCLMTSRQGKLVSGSGSV